MASKSNSCLTLWQPISVSYVRHQFVASQAVNLQVSIIITRVPIFIWIAFRLHCRKLRISKLSLPIHRWAIAFCNFAAFCVINNLPRIDLFAFWWVFIWFNDFRMNALSTICAPTHSSLGVLNGALNELYGNKLVQRICLIQTDHGICLARFVTLNVHSLPWIRFSEWSVGKCAFWC